MEKQAPTKMEKATKMAHTLLLVKTAANIARLRCIESSAAAAELN
jgi:hypothetical protein